MGSYLFVIFVSLEYKPQESRIPKLLVFVTSGMVQYLIMVGTQIAFLNSGSKISATCLRYNEKDPRHKLDLSSSTGSVINKLYNLGCITSSLCALVSSSVQ